MSVEEDTELRDLVSQTLENNGVLSKIRAELRASVFLAVEEQESHISKTPFVNNALKEYLSTPHGALGLSLVKEFLEYLELDFTISVYNPETRCGKDYEYEGRTKLLKDLQIKNINGKKGPVLAHILQIAQRCNEAHMNVSDTKEESLGSFELKPESLPSDPKPHLTINCSQNHGDHGESSNISFSPLNRTFITEGSSQKDVHHLDSTENPEDGKPRQSPAHSQPALSSSESQHRLRLQPDSNMKYISSSYNIISDDNSEKSQAEDIGGGIELNSHFEEGGGSDGRNRRSNSDKASQSQSPDGNNPMTSLNNLPPLEGIQGKRALKTNCSTLLIANVDSQEHYEEDFQSTESSAVVEGNSKSSNISNHSNKAVKGGKGGLLTQKAQDVSDKEMSDKGTDTPSICEEIEEDTNSEVDDLLISTASGENTMEATISHVTSNLADYCENL